MLGAGDKCPKCGEVHARSTVLDLFGASFSPQQEPGAAALATRIAESATRGDTQLDTQLDSQEDSPELDPAARAARFRAAAQLLQKQEEVRDLRCKLKEQLETIAAARVLKAKQDEKWEAAKKALSKKEKEVTQLKEKGTTEDLRHAKLLEDINNMRVRDTTLEYWDRVKAGREADALKYLSTMVGLGGSPWRILAEVARLRDHVRKQLDAGRKEAAAVANRLKSARHLLAELELEQKRSKLAGRSRDGGPGLLQAPAAKRLRPQNSLF